MPATARELVPKAALWAWLTLCLVLPISGALVPVPMGITIALCFACLLWKRPVIAWHALWPLFAWYLLHVVGMLWTTDIGFGLFDLQVKLGLLLLPIAAAALLLHDAGLLRKSMAAFTVGILVSLVLGVWKAYGCWTLDGQWGCFSQSTLSHDLHPSYAAWYACWAMLWWGQRLLEGQGGRWLSGSMLLLLLLWIGLLASKSGLIGMVLVVGLLLLRGLRTASGRSRWALGLGVVLAVLATILLQGPVAGDRLKAGWDAVQRAASHDTSFLTSSESNDLRLVAWSCSIDRLKADPFGAGTGDIKHALMDCYAEKGAVEAAARRLNSHSQILQGAVALGWPGLLLSLALLLVPMYHAWRQRDALLMGFALLFLVNASVESVLEVQAGVLFAGLFLGLLLHKARSSHDNTPARPLTI